jgi:YhcH/YjgK/YiaL family protein
MIIDLLANAYLYGDLTPRLTAGLAYLQQTDFTSLDPGRYEIEGDRLFANVQDYETRPQEAGAWEAHRRYWDLQYLVSGEECVHYANIGHLKAGHYDPEKDYLPLEGEGDRFTLREGMFVVLSPQDAHMPGMALGRPGMVRKVVVKIAVE